MRRRHLAKRLERIAGLKEQHARVARARAERRLRECEEEIVRLEQAQADAEREILQNSRIAGFSPLALIESSREATHLAVERQREIAIVRREELGVKVASHVKTLAERHSAEKVRERVVQRWRAERDRRERMELDDLAGIHHGRK